jgi:hypothetical protein
MLSTVAYFMHSIGLISPARMVRKAWSVSSDGVSQSEHMSAELAYVMYNQRYTGVYGTVYSLGSSQNNRIAARSEPPHGVWIERTTDNFHPRARIARNLNVPVGVSELGHNE